MVNSTHDATHALQRHAMVAMAGSVADVAPDVDTPDVCDEHERMFVITLAWEL